MARKRKTYRVDVPCGFQTHAAKLHQWIKANGLRGWWIDYPDWFGEDTRVYFYRQEDAALFKLFWC